MKNHLGIFIFINFIIFFGCKNILNRNRSNRNVSLSVYNQGFEDGGSPGFEDKNGLLGFYFDRAAWFLGRLNLCQRKSGPLQENCPYKDEEMKLVRLIDPQNGVHEIKGYTLKSFFLNKGPDKVEDKLKCFINDFSMLGYLSTEANLMGQNSKSFEPAACHDSWDEYNDKSFWISNDYMKRRESGFDQLIKEPRRLYDTTSEAEASLTFPIVRVDFTNYEYLRSKLTTSSTFPGSLDSEEEISEKLGPANLKTIMMKNAAFVKHKGNPEDLPWPPYNDKWDDIEDIRKLSSDFYVVIDKEEFTKRELDRDWYKYEDNYELMTKQLAPLYKSYTLLRLDHAFNTKSYEGYGPIPHWSKLLNNQATGKRELSTFKKFYDDAVSFPWPPDWTGEIVHITYKDLGTFIGQYGQETEDLKVSATDYKVKHSHNISITQVSNLVVNTGFDSDDSSSPQTSPVFIEDYCYLEPNLDQKFGDLTLKQFFDLPTDSGFVKYFQNNRDLISVKKVFRLNCDTNSEEAAKYIAQEDFTEWSDHAKRQLAAQIGVRFAENILMFETGFFYAKLMFADWIIKVAKVMMGIYTLKMLPNFYHEMVDYRMCIKNNTNQQPCFAIMEESLLNMAFMVLAHVKTTAGKMNKEVLQSAKNKLEEFTSKVLEITEESDLEDGGVTKDTYEKWSLKLIRERIEFFFKGSECKVD